MEKTSELLIYLMACSLQGTKPEEALLANIDMEALLRLAKAHSVSAMVCMALEQTDAFQHTTETTRLKWLDSKNKAIRKNMLLDAERHQLEKEFAEHGIWYMPLKGSILKDWYPKFGMREMADNDILFDATRRQQVRDIFVNRGYSIESYNKSNNDAYEKQPIYNFEMHVALFHEDCSTLQKKYENVVDRLVQDQMVSYLWDDARGAMFDRDKNHNQMPTLIHNTLRCMYWHSLPDALAERFVKEHLLNPQEFWTKMPLPSVAANDPLFRNVTTNNWSGQAEALTYQRAIRALENYGMYELIPQLGQKLMQAIGPQCRFVQQYDPFTGEPSVICEPGQPPQDAYGPAMLSVLEYTARMYGVSLVRDTVVWGTCPLECRYTQALNGRSWEIVNSGHEAEAFVDGRKVFTAGPGLRITTDLDGNILGTARYLPDADPAQVTPQ